MGNKHPGTPHLVHPGLPWSACFAFLLLLACCLRACVRAFLPACLLACLLACWLACLPACCLPACLAVGGLMDYSRACCPPACQAAEKAREVALTEAKERAKLETKESLKEELREGRKVSSGQKVRMEESLGRRFPGTPGLGGKEHTATGPRFLQALLKSKKDNNYELPPWEERYVDTYVESPPPPKCSCACCQDHREGGIG